MLVIRAAQLAALDAAMAVDKRRSLLLYNERHRAAVDPQVLTDDVLAMAAELDFEPEARERLSDLMVRCLRPMLDESVPWRMAIEAVLRDTRRSGAARLDFVARYIEGRAWVDLPVTASAR